MTVSEAHKFAAAPNQILADAVEIPDDCRRLLSQGGYESLGDFLNDTKAFRQISISDLNLSVRSRNSLRHANIQDVGELLLLKKEQVLKFKHMGINSLLNIGQSLNAYVKSRHFLVLMSVELIGPDRQAMESSVHETPGDIEGSVLKKFGSTGWKVPKEIKGDLDALVLILDLPQRALSVLNFLHIDTVRELLSTPPDHLLSQENCGRKTIAEMEIHLFEYLRTGSEFDETEVSGFKTFVEQQLAKLDERSSNVLRDRYGLWDDISETLQEIGDKLNLTRERIRQIELKAKKKLSRTTSVVIKNFVQKRLMRHFSDDEHSGVIAEAELATVFADDCTEQEAAVGLQFIIELVGSSKELFGPVFTTPEPGVYAAGHHIQELYHLAVNRMREALAQKETAMRIEELISAASADLENTGLFFRKVLSISSSFRIINNEFAVSSDWSMFSSKTTNALCRIALSFSKKPMHFTDVARKIMELNPELSSINHRTVHNELVKRRDLFVNVGEGTYALTEWGVKRPPFLKEALIRVLSESSYPLPYWYIEQQMANIHAYKKTSIRMSLDLNPSLFRRYDNDHYMLRADNTT